MNPIPVIPRHLALDTLLEQKAYFLLGPCQTGKSFHIGESLKGARVYDLLDTSMYLALSHRPQRLAEEITPNDRVVVIDDDSALASLVERGPSPH